MTSTTTQIWTLVAQGFSAILDDRRVSRGDLGEALGMSRTTVWRKLVTLDGPTLRAVAEHLDVQYRHILVAMLIENGDITAPGDLVVGLPASVVIDTEREEPSVAGVFFDSQSAESLSDFLETKFYVGNQVETSAVAPPGYLPPHVVGHRAEWGNRDDTITFSERYYPSNPVTAAHVNTRGVVNVTVTATKSGIGVTSVATEAWSAGAAEARVRSFVQRCSSSGLLADRTMNPYPNGFVDRLMPLGAARTTSISHEQYIAGDDIGEIGNVIESLAAHNAQKSPSPAHSSDPAPAATQTATPPAEQEPPKELRSMTAALRTAPYQWGPGQGDERDAVRQHSFVIETESQA